MIYGLLDLPWWGYIVCLIITTQFTAASITIFLHRHQAHKALDLHPIISHFFRMWLWLSTGMVTKQWVAIHRKHHVYSDVEGDPHSPVVFGLRKVLLEGTELYRAEGKNQETLERYGVGTPDDWMERNVYTKHSGLGLRIFLGLYILMFGVWGITMWAVQLLWTPVHAAGIINGIGHFFGYRNFECNDAARNIIPWGLFIGGEELHNNHHTFPTSAKLSVKWWEFDMGWFYITILRTLGLATVKKVPPVLSSVPGKAEVDAETLRALVTNRFQILARYSSDVMLPVLQEERHKAGERGRALFRRAKSLLVRAEPLIEPKQKVHLSEMLANCHTLAQVYQFRQRLQSIWERTTSSQKELLEALQEWCKQAEATGIASLREFALRLKTFVSMHPSL